MFPMDFEGGFHLEKLDLRAWALKGAEHRLVELAEEARAIFAAFPELRARGRGFEAPAGSSVAVKRSPRTTSQRRRRRRMSAEGRKRISEAQKKRWAKQRARTARETKVAGRKTK
jgi:hypothetical protein